MNKLLLNKLSLEILDIASKQDRPNFETIIQDFVISYNSDPKRKGSWKEINISHVILTINNILFGEHSVGDGLGNVFYMNKSFHRIINNIPKS
mgnify:CR=1 FL=1